jgi:hypothetical protein
MKRLLPFLLIILIIVGGLVALPFLLQTERYRNQLADYLTRRLGHTVVIRQLQIGLLPPSIRLVDVSMLAPQVDTALFYAQTMTVLLDVGALFALKVAPQALAVDRWQAIIRRKADGSWAWDEWVPSLAQLPAEEHWPLSRVTLGSGEVHALDPYSAGAQELVAQVHDAGLDRARQVASASGGLSSGSTSANFVFQGQGHFFGAPQWTGSLQWSSQNRQWVIDLKNQGDRLEAHGQSAEWPFDFVLGLLRFYSRWDTPIAATPEPLLLRQWDWQVAAQSAQVTFTETSMVGGGQEQIDGSVTLSPGAAPVLVATAAVRGVNVQALDNALWGSSHWEGSATGLAHMRVALSSEPWSNAQGTGFFEVINGRYHWPEVSAKSLSRAHMMAYFQKKYPGFIQNGLPFNRLSGHWQASGGNVSLKDGYIDLGDVKTGVVAKMDAPRHGVDAYLRLQIHETNPALVKKISHAYVYEGVGKSVIQPIFGHLQGTWDEWHLRANSSSKVPAAIRAKLQQALRSK